MNTGPALSDLMGWGRSPVIQGRELRSENLEAITERAVLSRGLGRSYGDASLPPRGGHTVATTTLANRLLAFDTATGTLRAEAGISLVDLRRIFLARGWFAPSTPGTEQVTLGGMVAADVHGKSHHREGCFGRHVRALKMRVAGGRILEVSENVEPDLFHATLGGMGLTGHILEVEFQMQKIPSPWIWTEAEQVTDVYRLVERLQEAGKLWPYTVAWFDGVAKGSKRGRGVLQKGRWATPDEAPGSVPAPKSGVGVPVQLPDWFLRPFMVRLFNAAYYHAGGLRAGGRIVHPVSFFYPLDALGHWNRLYGHSGLTQYQCVLPLGGSLAAFERVFKTLDEAGAAPFLCVLKDFQGEGRGMISFPKCGLSIALEMPIRPLTQGIVDRLNDIVAAEGGRVYLAKDALTRAEHFLAMEPRLEAWARVRRRWDPNGKLRSALSVRLLGDAE